MLTPTGKFVDPETPLRCAMEEHARSVEHAAARDGWARDAAAEGWTVDEIASRLGMPAGDERRMIR